MCVLSSFRFFVAPWTVAHQAPLSKEFSKQEYWEVIEIENARWSNQSILKEISPGCSLERMMLKLKLQYFGHLMQGVDSVEKTVMLGGIGGRRRKGHQRMRWMDGITDLMDMSFEWTLGVGDGQGDLVCCDSWGHQESDTTKLNWTDGRNQHSVTKIKKKKKRNKNSVLGVV